MVRSEKIAELIVDRKNEALTEKISALFFTFSMNYQQSTINLLRYYRHYFLSLLRMFGNKDQLIIG